MVFDESFELTENVSLIQELSLSDGLIAILCIGNRLAFEIGRINEFEEVSTDQWITPELMCDERQPIIVSIGWKDASFSWLRINSKNVNRGSSEESWTLPAVRGLNAYVDEVPEPNGIHEIPTAMKRQLEQTVARLERAVNNLRSNAYDVVLDIAVYLRVLLTGGDGGLLFRCADKAGREMFCFTVHDTSSESELDLALPDSVCLSGVASAFPVGTMTQRKNLKGWLSEPAVSFNGHSIPHWRLIRLVADKYGAHADIDKLEMLPYFTAIHDKGVNLGALVPMFKQYAELTLYLSKSILLVSSNNVDER